MTRGGSAGAGESRQPPTQGPAHSHGTPSRVFDVSLELKFASESLRDIDLYLRLVKYKVQTRMFMYGHRPWEAFAWRADWTPDGEQPDAHST